MSSYYFSHTAVLDADPSTKLLISGIAWAMAYKKRHHTGKGQAMLCIQHVIITAYEHNANKEAIQLATIQHSTWHTCTGKLTNFRASYWHQLLIIFENEPYAYL
jgi:hypothetical protein